MKKLEAKNRRGELKQIRQTVINEDITSKKREMSPGRHEARLIDTTEYQGLVEKVFNWLKEGMRSNEIYAMLLIEDPSFYEERFAKLLKVAYEYGENELHKDREYTFMLHMNRYEKIYNDCVELLDTWHRPLDPVKDWHIITAKYYNALKAMKSKEDLLGLHDKSMVIEFNDHKAVVVEQSDFESGRYIAGYDLDKLTLEDMKSLLELIQESRTVPIEGVQRVIVKSTKIEINTNSTIINTKTIDNIDTVDIGFEEMPERVVDKFKDITLPVEKEEEPTGGPKIIDLVGEVENKPVESKQAEIVEKLNQGAIEVFKQRLKQQKDAQRTFDSENKMN